MIALRPRGRLLSLLALAFLVVGSGTVLHAEDPPPPPAPAGGEAPSADLPPLEQEEAQRVDVIAWLHLLKGQLEDHLQAPERRGGDRALRDAWASILKPRAARMARRVDRLLEERRWVRPEGAEGPAHLAPGAWSGAVKELAALYVELAGALAQYERVRVTYSAPPRYGPNPLFLEPEGALHLHRNLWDLERIAADHVNRWRRGGLDWADEAWRWWALARYAAFELERFERAAARYEKERESLEDLQQQIQSGLALKREMLRVQMFNVRSLAAALQAEEEARLRTKADALPEGSAERDQALELSARLWRARMEAQERLERPAEYGSILRGDWLRTRSDLVRRLDKVAAETEDPADDVEPVEGE